MSESEGELKKRIFPPKPDDWDERTIEKGYVGFCHKSDAEFIRTITSADNVWMILDEAKQELEQAEKEGTPLKRFLQYRKIITKWFGRLSTENEYYDDASTRI